MTALDKCHFLRLQVLTDSVDPHSHSEDLQLVPASKSLGRAYIQGPVPFIPSEHASATVMWAGYSFDLVTSQINSWAWTGLSLEISLSEKKQTDGAQSRNT